MDWTASLLKKIAKHKILALALSFGFVVFAVIILACTAKLVARWTASHQKPEVLQMRSTALHSLSIRTYSDLIPLPAADGGAIEGSATGMLLAVGDGTFHWVKRNSPEEDLSAKKLPIPPPIDR